MHAGITGSYVLARVLSDTSIWNTLVRNETGAYHRKITLLLLLWLMMAASMARTMAGLVAFLLYDFAGRHDTIQIIENGYRVATIIYILVDIVLALIPLLIIRTLSIKSSLNMSTRAMMAVGSIACLAALLIVPGELSHPGSMDDFVSDWLFELVSVFLWKETEDGLGLIFMLYPDDLETLLNF